MTSKKLRRLKGRCFEGRFIGFPAAVLESKNWQRCSGTAIKLLVGLAFQYKGGNNGDLSPATVGGRPAHQAMAQALRELCHYGLLLQTKHGGLGMPSLYALTWHPIDDCGPKLEVGATTKPPGYWKEERPDFKPPRKNKSQGCKSALVGLKLSPLQSTSELAKAVNQPLEAPFNDSARLKISQLLRSTMQCVGSNVVPIKRGTQ